MTPHNAANERIKRRYFLYLREARRQSELTASLRLPVASFGVASQRARRTSRLAHHAMRPAEATSLEGG